MICGNLAGMKVCVKCQASPRIGKTQAYCKICLADYMKEWRKKNPARVKALNRATYTKYHERRLEEASVYREGHALEIRQSAATSRATKRRLIDELKAQSSCADCGGRFPPVAMDFDHVRGVKKFNIAKIGGSQMSTETLLEEIAKCELVCANCHRVRTQRRGQGWHGGNPSKKGVVDGVL